MHLLPDIISRSPGAPETCGAPGEGKGGLPGERLPEAGMLRTPTDPVISPPLRANSPLRPDRDGMHRTALSPETAFSGLEIPECAEEIDLPEEFPVHVREEELGIHGLPDQEVCQVAAARLY